MKEIRLDLNEMPYPPSKRIIRAAKDGLESLNRYASVEDLELLRGLLSDYANIPKRHIILSFGSEILLRQIIHQFSSQRKVLMVSPSFFPTVQAAKQFGTKLVRIRLTPPKFELNMDALLPELKGPCLVVIDNPNNPTGNLLLDQEKALAILKNEDTLLAVDEAYYEFSQVTFGDLIKEYPHLAISRTLNKAFCLAGARIGYLMAGEDFLNSLSPPYTYLPQPSLLAAVEALKNPSYMKEKVSLIAEEKRRVRNELMEMGVTAYPSSTNFLLVQTKIPELARKLKDQGVLVDDLAGEWISGYIRVSIGKTEENDIFLARIKDIIESYKI